MNEEAAYYSLTKKAFDVLALFYDLVCIPIWGVRDTVVQSANLQAVSKVLDVATGTGQQAFAFARKGHEVVGVDVSEAMLAVANKNNGYPNVRFEQVDATRLRFEDNHFDLACISFALHDMPRTIGEKVLREMVRVTKPEGSIVVVDYAVPGNKVSKLVLCRLISLYEGPYYAPFLAYDLDAALRNTGVEIQKKTSILFGAGRILYGKKTVARWPEPS
jgi:demethylmenaquinone methyltransferase/2-methoxy-6-polyprenyl-1,4-benzoquinol methylase